MMRTALLVVELLLNIVLLVAKMQEEKRAAGSPHSASPALSEVASFDVYQPTGVAVSKAGRVFVNFPLWSDDYRYAVVEILPDGSTRPYPNEQWNSWQDAAQAREGDRDDAGAMPIAPSKAFVCVQSVWVDDRDRLWILDAASPRMEGVVPGGPKLVCVDLTSNNVDKVIEFGDDIAPSKSYLNDVRIDSERNYAYITESGLGAIIAVNLANGEAKRLLDDHPSTKAEKDLKLMVQGVELRDDKSGSTPEIHADGIALSDDGEHLYYHALTGKALYRVPTAALRGESDSLSESAIGELVEKVAQTVVTDGMLVDDRGNVYHTALERDAIVRFNSESKVMESVVQDQSIAWPDTMAWGPDGALYVTTSQIHRMPRFNEGQSTRTEPYRIYKIDIK
jgi:sugar lactone lactonase YvrE